MDITKEETRHLATLCKLDLSEAELDGLTGDLAAIVDYIGQLSALDTKGVRPTYQVTGLKNVWREDEVRPGVDREKLLDLAPSRRGDAVEVPKVL
jgi:aspartyl-tRNA(Asn)/glutamyl-tRNA(Gln) amidotransferase subunit C